jgi:predicted DNA-binding WGR domain protein
MRRFEFVQGTSAKFWTADTEGNNFVVVFGRLGTPGQRKEKAFPTPEAAQRELDKKIAEKLREGYHEVATSSAAAPPTGAKGAAAASARLELPPRGRDGAITPERVKAAAEALAALQEARGRRSWALAWRARLARRALQAVAGIDPAGEPALAAPFDAVLARVIAPKAADRIPLGRAVELLYEVDAAAFARTVQQTWKDPPAGHPAARAIAVLEAQLAALGDPELALRVGALLVDRQDRGAAADAGWTRRWKAISPHLEAHLVRGGGSLKGYLKGIDAAGDAHLARRVERMQGA